MTLHRTKVTARGLVSIPTAIRQTLRIGPGSVLEWVDDGESIVVRKVGRYSSEDIHRAVFATPPKARTLEELKRARECHAAAKGKAQRDG